MFKRILLKLSGEVLAGSSKQGIEEPAVIFVANQVKKLKDKFPELEVAIVIGGGNIFRGKKNPYIERVKADYIGSMGTVINSMALSSALEKLDIVNTVMTPFNLDVFASKYNAFEGRRILERGETVILGGGTGHPFFTTDTNAALRASELQCDLIIKATKVDGLYDRDPEKFSDAVFIDEITFDEVIKKDLQVMDITAFTLCRENNIPIFICNLTREGQILDFLEGKKTGSIVRGGKK
jgi:uridylate kinase